MFFSPSVVLSDVQDVANPLDKVKAGLQAEGADVPLQSVHIRAQLIDLAAKVVVMQAYKNNSFVAIEAKYVFPLDDMAAVCGFEAFINGKHIVGQVKEKEQAHKEYREAIAKGHGAYLMDEETPVREGERREGGGERKEGGKEEGGGKGKEGGRGGGGEGGMMREERREGGGGGKEERKEGEGWREEGKREGGPRGSVFRMPFIHYL